MSISQKIEKEIFEMSCGQIFSYSELAEYRKSPQAVKKIVRNQFKPFKDEY